jgi:hypothetical protein
MMKMFIIFQKAKPGSKPGFVVRYELTFLMFVKAFLSILYGCRHKIAALP